MSRRGHITKDAAALSQAPLQTDLEDFTGRTGQPGGPNRTALMQRELTAYTSKARRVAPPFERYRQSLPQELEDAARLLLHDFLLASSIPEGSKATVPPDVRNARMAVAMIKAELHPDFVRDIEFFITCVVHRHDGSPMRLEDSGAQMFPNNSKDAQRWAGAGGLFRTLQAAARAYARHKALGKPGTPSSTGDREILGEKLKVLAQRRRERDTVR